MSFKLGHIYMDYIIQLVKMVACGIEIAVQKFMKKNSVILLCVRNKIWFLVTKVFEGHN